MTTVAGLEALRAKAGVQEKSDAIAALRVDFALIWKARRAYGYVTEDERTAGVKADGEMVRGSLQNPESVDALSKLCADAADAIRSDRARSDRIAAEMRAERQAKRGAA